MDSRKSVATTAAAQPEHRVPIAHSKVTNGIDSMKSMKISPLALSGNSHNGTSEQNGKNGGEERRFKPLSAIKSKFTAFR